MSIRRNNLNGINYHPDRPQFQPHTGLWFDKYLKKQKGETLEPYVDHIELTSQIRKPHEYEAFFNRWQDELTKMGAQMREADVVGRLAAGLGGESVIENGMTLHHTYGVPIIPGSSLKGTARAYAAANLADPWAERGAAFRTLFGGQVIPPGEKPKHKARVGIAVFYDALPVPGPFGIHNEVMTVHHREYYQTGEKPPADWDSPTPIPFPSVSGRFLLALHAPAAPEWAASGMGILKMALKEIGVGGKTSSGFGRFLFAPPPGYHRGVVEHFGRANTPSFGFIFTDPQKTKKIFVHRTSLREGIARLNAGDVVDYKIGKGPKGKDQAQDVHFP